MKLLDRLVGRRPLSTRIVEHLPQTVDLRSGVRVHLRGAQDASEFWHVFSNREYMGLMPLLGRLELPEVHLVDGGAGTGLFTLLVEHLRRIDVLPWPRARYTMVEAGDYNRRELERNAAANLPPGYTIHGGLIGRRDGAADFYESRRAPWSSSTAARAGIGARCRVVPYLDLTAALADGPVVLKLDVEGAEFPFLDAYADRLDAVRALVIEWHAELGDVARGRAQLAAAGLGLAKRSWDNGNRLVECYLR